MSASEMREYAEAAKARADAATDGPWEPMQIVDPEGKTIEGWHTVGPSRWKEDDIFIAAARADVPALALMVLELLEAKANDRSCHCNCADCRYAQRMYRERS